MIQLLAFLHRWDQAWFLAMLLFNVWSWGYNIPYGYYRIRNKRGAESLEAHWRCLLKHFRSLYRDVETCRIEGIATVGRTQRVIPLPIERNARVWFCHKCDDAARAEKALDDQPDTVRRLEL